MLLESGNYDRSRTWTAGRETHWQAYLDGKVSREEAIRQILIETASVKK